VQIVSGNINHGATNWELETVIISRGEEKDGEKGKSLATENGRHFLHQGSISSTFHKLLLRRRPQSAKNTVKLSVFFEL